MQPAKHVHFNFQLHSYVTLLHRKINYEQFPLSSFKAINCTLHPCIILQVKIAENVIRLSRFLFEKIKIILPWSVQYTNVRFLVQHKYAFPSTSIIVLWFYYTRFLMHFQFDIRDEVENHVECLRFLQHCCHFPGLLLFLFSFLFICWLLLNIGSNLVMQSTFNNIYQYLMRVSLSITLMLSAYFDMTASNCWSVFHLFKQHDNMNH